MSSIIEGSINDSGPIQENGQTIRRLTYNQPVMNTEDAKDPNNTPTFVVLSEESTENLQVTGTPGAFGNILITGAGNDTITGGFIADTIDGGTGNDLIEGFKGADLLAGGEGNDTIYGDSMTPGVTEDGNDTIYGGAGNDLIYGGAGDDSIYGGIGADTLYGGTGNDSIYGGAGNDIISGGAGADTLTGGEGADVFEFLNTDGSTSDTVTDFTTGEDKVRLGGFDPNSAVTYDQASGSLKVNGQEIANLGAGTVFDVDPTDGTSDFEIL
jgi:Ca2+-binding RTX toxin-like protein